MQIPLLELSTSSSGRSGFSDPNFSGNKARPIHRWVPWIAGFSSAFVKDILCNYLPTRGVVLDPFAGVGTTLVEAASLGHDVIGFEINPYAALACRVKLSAARLSANALRQAERDLRTFGACSQDNGYVPHSSPPDGFKTRYSFFSPRVLRKVLIVQDYIDTLDDLHVAEIFQLAFAATMISFSNYSYEPSLGARRAVGKGDVVDFAVVESVCEKIKEIVTDIEIVSPSWPDDSKATVINASFFRYCEFIDAMSADVCITSPPYLNNYHYIRNTRPQMYWLGLVKGPRDTDTLEQQNFGKYWQTVREQAAIGLDFPDPPADLVTQLDRLRELKPEKGVYGGSGWANYAATYFNDCYRFVLGLRHALKRNGHAFVVIGNSILQGMMIPTDVYFGQVAESAGLRLVGIDVPRSTRVGNSIIQSSVRVEKAQASHQLYESVVHLRAP